MVRKNFYGRGNDAFTCEHCGAYNPPLSGSYRNHCRACMFSKHVDLVAGDRLATCHELMAPVGVSHEAKKGWVITQRCPCGHTRRNKAATDDDFDVIIALS